MAKLPKILAAAILVCAICALPSPLPAKKKPEKFGVIAGTVFQQSGFSLQGATIMLTPTPEEGGEINTKDIQKTVSDRRGEFSFRVPAGAMRYTVRVEAEGWQPAEKTVESQWDQKVGVTFRLKPATAGEDAK